MYKIYVDKMSKIIYNKCIVINNIVLKKRGGNYDENKYYMFNSDDFVNWM